MAAALFAGQAGADAGADAGFYLRGELGVLAAPALHLLAGDNDRASRCDEFVNPAYAALPGCTDPDRGAGAVDDWQNRFGAASGTSGGIGAGYRFGMRWAAEIEYSRDSARYGETSLIEDPAGVPYTEIFGAELPRAEERIDRIVTGALFANVRLRFGPRRGFTPFVGAGAGAARARMGYSVLWMRDPDPATVASAAGLPNEDEVRRNLAGTASSDAARLADTLAAYQVFAGVEFPLGGALSLTFKARYAEYARFDVGGEAYDRLRGHVSNLRRDGSEPVAYRVSAGDLGGWSVGAGISRRVAGR